MGKVSSVEHFGEGFDYIIVGAGAAGNTEAWVRGQTADCEEIARQSSDDWN